MASALPGEKKQKKTDGNNNFFILDMPMNADGREDTWLGVAFEDRKRGTHERYTPQGPGEITIEEVKEEVESTVVSTYSALSKGLGWATGSAATEASSVSAQVTNQPPEPPLDLADVTYRTPCKWPKDLVKGIYPNEPTVAVGVEACLENVNEATLRTQIENAIMAGLKIRKSELDSTIVPVVRRWSMEDPWGKIDDLLHNDEYRARLISLFSFQSGQKIKVLSIATSIIACGGLEYDRLKESEQSIEGDAKDPTGTAGPFKVGGKVYRVKHSTLKGKYKSNIVFMMSYRRIRYERRLPNAPTAGWFWQKAYGQRQKSIDEQARSFQAAGQAGIDGEKDVFWIDTHETQKGDVPAWIGDESVSSFAMVETGRRLSEEPTALFENASLVDTTAGAEEEESGREQLPDGFFSSDDEELNT